MNPFEEPSRSPTTLTHLGPVGLWSRATEAVEPSAARVLARRYEASGFGVVWLPEGLGYEALTHASLLLEATTTLGVATGIASIWARDPMAAHAGTRLLRAAHDRRFLLGLGVSHRLVVDSLRGHTYDRPLAALGAYLDRLDDLDATVGDAGPRVVAALGPRMLDLASARGVGVLTYLTTVEHTSDARRRLGGTFLGVELPVVVGDPIRSRQVVREHLSTYLALESYERSFRRLGFDDDDLADDGSDRLVDAISAHGSIDELAAAVRARFDAGADHVAVQPLDEASLQQVLAAGAAALAP